MVGPHPIECREGAIALVDEDHGRREAVRRFRVSANRTARAHNRCGGGPRVTEFRIADTGREKPRNDFCVIALSEISAFARAVPAPPMG